jgi:hypothetical protein
MIGLVSCSDTKLSTPAPARELYTSTLFKKSLAYAESRCSTTYVLSAKHGLVALDKVLAPYDHKLERAAAPAWANRVAGDLYLEHGPNVELLVLAGDVYATPLFDELVFTFGFKQPRFRFPLAGKQIGERLHWLTRELARVQLVAPVNPEVLE